MKSSSRGGVARRDVLRTLGATAALSLFDPARLHHPLAQVPAGQSWAPRFLERVDVELVASVAEHIIPRTESPGARDAAAHEYVDFVLSQASEREQGEFERGLSWFTEYVEEEGGGRFEDLDPGRQHDLLERAWSAGTGSQGRAFVTRMKELTVEGYYRSEAGMHQELGFAGSAVLSVFPGCTHPEHHDWRPSVTDSRRDRG